MVSLFSNSFGLPQVPTCPKLVTILEWEEQKSFGKDFSTCYSVLGNNGEICF